MRIYCILQNTSAKDMQCFVVWCSTLQYLAVCCSVCAVARHGTWIERGKTRRRETGGRAEGGERQEKKKKEKRRRKKGREGGGSRGTEGAKEKASECEGERARARDEENERQTKMSKKRVRNGLALC